MDADILFWTKVAAIGQVVGAFATALAVIVSLWVVISERAARVTASAGLRLIFSGYGEPPEEVISIAVTNVGQRPLRISGIGWRTGWTSRLGPKWMRRQYAVQTSAGRRDSSDPPFLLEPGEVRTMLLNVGPFQRADQLLRNKEVFGRLIPCRGLVPANIQVSVSVVGARTAYFRVEKSLGKFLVTGESGALERWETARARAEGERVV